MKISKRTLTMVLSLVLAMSVTAFGTIAYMTDREVVTNTFTIGNVDITVDEEDADDDDDSPYPDEDGDGNPEIDLDGDGDPDIEIEVNPDGTITIDPTPENPDDPQNDIVIDPDDPSLPDADEDGKPEIDLDGDGDPDIEIDEDEDGNIIIDPTPDTDDDDPIVVDPTPDPDDSDRVTENDYDLIPGKTHVKDPTVTVIQGSEECYVRMRVQLNNIATLQEIAQKHEYPYGNSVEALLWQFAPTFNTAWEYKESEFVADDIVEFEFWYAPQDASDKVSAENEDNVLPALFEEITVPSYFDNDDLESFADFKMEVWGDAIQTESFDNATEAWAAFDMQIFNKDTNQQ